MDPSPFPPPDSDPPDRLELILRPESATNPVGLEQDIADIIRATVARLAAAPPPGGWTAPDPAERSPKAVAVEARVFHAIDEISTENARRVAERDQPPPPPRLSLPRFRRLVGWLVRLLRRRVKLPPVAPVPSVEDARKRIEDAVERCVRHGIIPAGEVTADSVVDIPRVG